MKVIFVKDVPRIGRKNDVKEMPDGYVRNFLLPRALAIIATPEALKKLERSKSEIVVEKALQGDLFKKNLRAVAGVGVTIAVKTNEQGHLFSAVHEKDIAEALKKEHRAIIDEEFIKLSEPIKFTGTFTVFVEALGMKEEITVNVVPNKK